MRSDSNPQACPYVAFVGLDWADQEHVLQVITPEGRREDLVLKQTPEAVAEWVEKMAEKFGPGQIAVCLEQSRGPVIALLLQYENLVLFPVNPKQLARFREAMYPSGSKDDPGDAELLAELVLQHRNRLRAWVPDDTLTRRIGRCCESRRKLVDDRKRLTQRLRQVLKEYYPLALVMFGKRLNSAMTYDFLMRWPTLKKAQRAHPDYLRQFFRDHNCRSKDRIEERIAAIRGSRPLTKDPAIIEPAVLMVKAIIQQLRALDKAIEAFDEEIATLFSQHEDRDVYTALPGAGAALAPRVLAAMGSDRERYDKAAAMQAFSGIAPVTKKSGKSQIVHRRYACPKFTRQTFHEFAEKSVLYSDWARAYYQLLRSRGKKHNAAVRALAFKWIRIIWVLWKNREIYDESKYIRSLQKRGSPITKFLTTT
jgi:transposase